MDPSINSASSWKIPHLVEEYLTDTTFHIPIIAVTETWLKPHITNAQIAIPKYQALRSDRKQRDRGGTLMYIHEDIPFTEEESFDNGYCELVVCTTKPSDTIIASLYRPPDTSDELFSPMLVFLQKYIDEATKNKHKEVIILGDFNLPCISWPENSVITNFSKHTTECARTLLSFMSQNFLSQYIDIPTRKNNVLDLFLTNSANLVLHVESEETKMSDHKLINIKTQYNLNSSVNTQKQSTDKHSFRALNLHKADYASIREHLKNVPWDDLRESCSAEEFSELFKLTVLQVCELNSPQRAECNNTINKYYRNRRILNRRRRKLQSKLNLTKTISPHKTRLIDNLNTKLNDIYIQIKDSITAQKRDAEQRAVQKIKVNPRFFFSYCKKFDKRKSNTGPLLDSENKLQQDPKVMADLLQQQYTSVFSDPSSEKIRSPSFEHLSENLLENITFSQDDIVSAISEIDTYAACGDEDIPAIVLKSCKEELSYPIWKIWRESLDTGVIPAAYKSQIITPVHKKGSKAKPSNYRPISLTSHVIKAFERVIRKKLVAFLEEENILCRNQHAFRKGRSCLTQLINYIDHVLQNFLENKDTDSIYLDFAKAFDKVDHTLLLEKLHAYRIRGKLHAWFVSYLRDRKQTVVVNGEKSFPAPVISGVPQGTVLGPILFILYLNDMRTCVKHSIISSFADDTRIQKGINIVEDKNLLQTDLNECISWSEANNMQMHADKFELLMHSTGSSKFLQELPFSSEFNEYSTSDGTCIYPSNIVRDLGINIVPDLQWSPHINSICDNTRRLIAWSLSVFEDRSPDTMLHIYKALIRSKLEYVCPVWDSTKIEDIITLEGVQRYYTSKINTVYNLHYYDRLRSLKLMSLQRRRERYSIIMMFKIINGITPNDLHLQWTNSERRGVRVKIPPIARDAKSKYVTMFDNSFRVRAAMLWNTIPAKLTVKPSMESFKNGLTAYLYSLPDRPPIQGFPSRNSLLDLNIHNLNEGVCWRRNSQ